VAGLLGAALLISLAALGVRRRIRRPSTPPAITSVLYLFDQETREARTELVRGSARLDVRRRPLRVAVVATAVEIDQGIAQIRPSSEGLLLYEPATEAAIPLVHDRLYALAGGAVTLRYREPSGGRPMKDEG
jgi:hypothetical protein